MVASPKLRFPPIGSPSPCSQNLRRICAHRSLDADSGQPDCLFSGIPPSFEREREREMCVRVYSQLLLDASSCVKPSLSIYRDDNEFNYKMCKMQG